MKRLVFIVCFPMLSTSVSAEPWPEGADETLSAGDVIALPLQWRDGNPASTADIFNWEGYRCDDEAQAQVRHINTSPSEIFVYDRPGATTPVRTLRLEVGAVVPVRAEQVATTPRRAYQVQESATCPISVAYCPWTRCTSPGDAILEAGTLVVPQLETPTRGDICMIDGQEGGEWLCPDDHSWLTHPEMACFARSMRPVTPRPLPSEAPLQGWWLQTDQGWIHDDGRIALQVQCASQHTVARCLAAGGSPARCQEAPSEPPWRSVRLDDGASVWLDDSPSATPLCRPGLDGCR